MMKPIHNINTIVLGPFFSNGFFVFLILFYSSNPAFFPTDSYSTSGTTGSHDSPLNKKLSFSFEKTISPQTDSPNSTQIFEPEGIITDSQDNLYVNDIQSNEIKKYDRNGTFVTAWGNLVKDDLSVSHPHSSEIDRQGNFYLTDQNNQRVMVLSSNGTLINTWGNDPNGKAQFLHPHGVAIDSLGNVFVSDRDLDNIQKFSNNGTLIHYWGGKWNGTWSI